MSQTDSPLKRSEKGLLTPDNCVVVFIDHQPQMLFGTSNFSGNMWPQLKAFYPDRDPIERSSTNSWGDRDFVAAVEKTGRKKTALCGLWTETCVALPTVQAVHDGYEIYVAEDCCGDVSQLAHDNAMRRVVQAGAKPVTALSVLLAWQRDWAQRETYDAEMDLVKRHFGAYGIGVELAVAHS